MVNVERASSTIDLILTFVLSSPFSDGVPEDVDDAFVLPVITTILSSHQFQKSPGGITEDFKCLPKHNLLTFS